MSKAKEIFTCILMFFFFAMMTVAVIFFGIEAVRCVKHFVDGTEIDIMELICLGFVAIAGGSAGVIWVICDADMFR